VVLRPQLTNQSEAKSLPIEAAVFPNAYQRIGEANQGESPLRD
jgi:hypothetical protein